MSPSRPSPAQRIIRRFGGQTALANLLGKRQSTIEHWSNTGRVPAQWHGPLMSLARQKGIVLEPKDFTDNQPHEIAPAEGKLGVLLVGLGAVASTLIAGVEHARRGSANPIGSLTQMGTIRLGKRTDNRMPLIRDFVPLAGLDQIVFGAWDPIPDNAYEAAVKCGVLDRHEHVEPIADYLKSIKPMPAVFDDYYVKRLHGTNVKKTGTKMEAAEALRKDIRDFGVILARAEVDYKSPAYHHEKLLVGCRVDSLGGSSINMSYRIEDKDTGRLVALAKTVLVAYDYALAKPVRVPQEAREKMEAFDGIA